MKTSPRDKKPRKLQRAREREKQEKSKVANTSTNTFRTVKIQGSGKLLNTRQAKESQERHTKKTNAKKEKPTASTGKSFSERETNQSKKHRE